MRESDELGEVVKVAGSAFERITCDKYLSLDGRIEVRRILGAETWIAKIDGEVVRGKLDKWKRLRTPEGAMKAAVAAIGEP